MLFNKKYFILFALIFLSEILIAKYANGFIRHTFGDFLAVIFVYCLVKSFIKISANYAAILSLIISFCVEFLQLTNLQNLSLFKNSKLLRIVIGTSFSIGDLIAYSFGFLTIIVIEHNLKQWHKSN